MVRPYRFKVCWSLGGVSLVSASRKTYSTTTPVAPLEFAVMVTCRNWHAFHQWYQNPASLMAPWKRNLLFTVIIIYKILVSLSLLSSWSRLKLLPNMIFPTLLHLTGRKPFCLPPVRVFYAAAWMRWHCSSLKSSGMFWNATGIVVSWSTAE